MSACSGFSESFEPKARKMFELQLKSKGGMPELRPKIESVLGRFHVQQELRASAEDHLTYEVSTPEDARLDRVSQALTGLKPEGELAVEWDDKKPAKKSA